MYDSVCEIAEYYEFYDEWQQAIRMRLEITGTSQGEEIFERWRQKHDKVERIARACFDAYCIYTIWMHRFKLRQPIPIQDPQLIKDIHHIKNAAEKTSSDQIHYYWLQLDAAFLQQQRNYRQARRSLEKLRALVENSRVLFTNHRLGNILLKLSENELHLHRFNRSIEYSQKAHALMQPGTLSEFQCLDAEFYGHFYNAHLSSSRMILQDLLNRDVGRSGLHRRSRRHFTLACILFLQGLYREANDLLLELTIIDADREGWNIALRTLLIMSDIERSLQDIAGKRIESARKHLRKLEAMEKTRPRDQLICESLKLLDQYNYDFKVAYQHLTAQFALLRSNHPDYRWEVKTPEMIIFHEWFFARVIKGEYIHKIPRYAEPDTALISDNSNEIPE
jgi:tetratricopeptide (TPR) repeat protein